MGHILDRRLCHKHQERTPSLIMYSDGKYYCHGCGAWGYNTEFGESRYSFSKPKPKEDMSKTRAYIDDLPLKEIRGLMLPADDKFYYVVYPGSEFYKKRKLNNDDTHSKYSSPVGHTAPLFAACVGRYETLLIIEGELNAASVHNCDCGVDVVSPGPCANFNLAKLKPLLTQLPKYKLIVICVDYDSAGVGAAIKLKAELVKINPNVVIQPMKSDFNEVLITHGKEAVKKTVEMQTRL